MPPNPVLPLVFVSTLVQQCYAELEQSLGLGSYGSDQQTRARLALAPLVGSMVEAIVAIHIERKDI